MGTSVLSSWSQGPQKGFSSITQNVFSSMQMEKISLPFSRRKRWDRAFGLFCVIACATVVISFRRDLIIVSLGRVTGWIPVDRECYTEQQIFEIIMDELGFGGSKGFCVVSVYIKTSQRCDRRQLWLTSYPVRWQRALENGRWALSQNTKTKNTKQEVNERLELQEIIEENIGCNLDNVGFHHSMHFEMWHQKYKQ